MSGAVMPLHQRIIADIEARILSGDWPPGHRIPFEHELTAHYGCARMTANKAISALTAAGLITRRRRAGSFVARPVIQSAILRIPDMKAEITGRGEIYGYELISRRRRKNRSKQDVLKAQSLLALHCLHLAGARPFALEQRVISLDAVPEALDVDFTTTPPGTWLLAQVPWTRAEHKISAVNASAAIADRLATPKGAACLAVERRTWRLDEEITHVRQIFPGALYSLTARFLP